MIRKLWKQQKKEKLDGAILGSKNTTLKKGFGYILHFVTYKNVNVKRLTAMLAEEGSKNGLYAKCSIAESEHSSRVYAANLKLIK